jgi:AhpD family alkylhydroperoxidase
MSTSREFPVHTLETASPAARPFVAGSQKAFGFLPSPVARLATAPAVGGAFMQLVGAFDRTSLDKLQREVVVLTIARENRCHYCMAMHSALLAADPAAASTVEALRAGTPLPDERLEALAQFVRSVLDGRGDVSDQAWTRFRAAGYDHAQALEVLLGVAAYTLSTYANRLTQAPLDAAFAAFAWPDPDRSVTLGIRTATQQPETF